MKVGATSSVLAVLLTISYSSGLNTNLSDLSINVTCKARSYLGRAFESPHTVWRRKKICQLYSPEASCLGAIGETAVSQLCTAHQTLHPECRYEVRQPGWHLHGVWSGLCSQCSSITRACAATADLAQHILGQLCSVQRCWPSGAGCCSSLHWTYQRCI